MSGTVAVIGGGIQGTLCALACSAAGWRVTLFERKPKLWQGASANNEGKIHLGFTYGLDKSGATQSRLAELGGRFEDALAAILGPLPAEVIVARRVIYARHALSALEAEATEAHLDSTAGIIGMADAIRRVPRQDADIAATGMRSRKWLRGYAGSAVSRPAGCRNAAAPSNLARRDAESPSHWRIPRA